MKQLLLVVIISYWCSACKKDAVEEYGNTAYVYLANHKDEIKAVDSIEYSFAFYPGVQQTTLPLIIKLMGKLSAADRPIALTVDAAHTTAAPADYQLPDPIVLHAGRAVDTIPLVLHNAGHLLAKKVRVRLVLNENEHFLPGPVGNRFIDVIFSDMIARPGWWDQVIETNFLGRYSDTKYRLFIEATGKADMTKLPETEQRAYAIIFRDFLARGRENGEVYTDEYGMINVSRNLF